MNKRGNIFSGKKIGKIASVDHPIIQKKIDKSLKLSVKEGSLASVSTGFGLSYFPAFALAMNATSSEVGILHAIINLLPGIIQLKASDIIGKFSRKKVVLLGVLLQALLWIPIILTGFLFYIGVPYTIWIFILLVGLFYGVSAFNYPAWFSWMGSLVPQEKRGKYFARRNLAIGFFGIVTMIIGAIILDNMKKIGIANSNILGYTLLGFGILFVLASSSKFWAWTILSKQYEPRIHIRKKDGFSFWQFLRRAPSNPFGKFSLFRGFLSVAIGIASPFWAVYMLRNLQFSYLWFMTITVSGTLFQLLFLPLLGKASDKFGNIRIMKISVCAMFLIPFLWFFSPLINSGIGVKIYLLLVPSIVSGFAWAGYNLASTNYVYDAVSQRKQSYGVSYMNFIVGLGMFIGASIGSLIAWAGVSFMDSMLFIFLISGCSRFLVVVIGLKCLKEVRPVSKFKSKYLFKEFRPIQDTFQEIHNLEYVVKEVEHFILPKDKFA